MDMIGLESVKRRFMEIKNLVDTTRRQGVDLEKEYFGCLLVGNPGTGKTTVAALYGNLLSSLDIVPGSQYETNSGSQLADSGIEGCMKLIEKVETSSYDSPGGVILIDEADQLLSGQGSSSGMLEYLAGEIDRLRGKVVFVFAGCPKPMESFLGSTPGLQSRIPFQIKFDNYEDGELHRILVQLIKKKFSGKMRVEDGASGLYMRIVIRRIGRARGRDSFANARQVQNTFLSILMRQASRIAESRRRQEDVDDFFLTKTDLIGPPPSTALENSKAWKSLQGMIGLAKVKEEVRAMIDLLQVNYERELAEQPLVECSLNKVFLGNPGTGKTTVAAYYGQILVDIGLLSNGEVMIRNPSDFIGGFLGQSENVTKAILKSAQGKVLIIDEAYALSGATDESSTSSSGNSYKTAVVDTIVAEVQSTASEDRCVLLLGYKERMETMFQSVNPALGRRFPLSSAFNFEDYTDDEMRQILDIKLQVQGFTASDYAKEVAMGVLGRARNHRNYGNAGEVDILLDRAKSQQQKRLSALGSCDMDAQLRLEPQDFDLDFDRAERPETNIHQIFSDFVGAEALIDKLEGYRRVVQNSKALGLDPRMQVPFNFLFQGPPGTGKTTTARRMGEVFYDMGLLATKEVADCSATDLIAEFVGQTGPKTQRVFQKALGKVLFIDEAYRLSDSRFGHEAVVEMMNLLTHDKYKNKLITILAGYDKDINQLLAVNSGFGSRFPEVLSFHPLSPTHCYELLVRCLQEQKLDTSPMQPSRKVLFLFRMLAVLPAWGNARDVQTLAKSIFGTIMRAPTQPPSILVTETILYSEMGRMISERQQRANDAASTSLCGQTTTRVVDLGEYEDTRQGDQAPIVTATSSEVVVKCEVAPKTATDEPDCNLAPPEGDEPREPGVSDETWALLKTAKIQAKKRRTELEALRAQVALLESDIAKAETALAAAGADSPQVEGMRLKLETMRVNLQNQRSKLKKARSRAASESEITDRLMASGLCPWGCEWIKEPGGYRCSAGACFKSHDDIWKDYGLSSS
ncbi:ATPases of the AAA+ class [Thozetella sp. PMI_491]|nr:ATPases of the AAA+ class [Thozetella sp. PMI_491]